VLLAVVGPCAAQTPISLHVNAAFFGDDTELSNPFRIGETIIGSFQQIFADIEANDRVTLRLGVYAREQAGSHSPVDRALPIVTLRLHSPTQQLLLGTLATDHKAFGPDRTTPHALLPPLAIETLWFSRSYEAGVQWLVRTEGVRHDLWYDYQKLNTPEHRERFDAGMVGRVTIAGPAAFAYQVHLVHHGGELYGRGPVSDSLGYGPGLIVERPLGGLDAVSFEAFGLVAHDRPDRAVRAARTLTGQGLFLRAAVEEHCWRGHAIVWRGKDFNHEDGDPNYLSRYSSGVPYVGTRDYSEAGLAKLFQPAPGVDFEVSGRVHRVERDVGYSFRLLATVHLQVWRTPQ